MHSVRIELAKMILVGTRITYQATGDAARDTIIVLLVYHSTATPKYLVTGIEYQVHICGIFLGF